MSSDHETLVGGIDESSPLFQKLLLENKDLLEKGDEPESKLVAPNPGWCIKTWFKNGKKLFVNICTSTMVLKPKDLSEEEVREIFLAEDPTKFRIPMGIGELHKEKDKEGIEVDVYDIVIHPDFLKKCEKISFFKEFFVMLVFDGLEDKYSLELNREHRILKNRKSIGTLAMQNVRSKSKPVIMEMNPSMVQMEKEFLEEEKRNEEKKTISVISEIASTKSVKKDSQYVTPKYSMIQEPDTGYPSFLVFEIELPKQDSTKNMLLDVGEDCLILHGNDGNYKLDIDLPYDVDNDNAGAQFHRKTKVLTITIPVLPQK